MTTPTLLGYLAKFGSFSTQSEVLCTQGLAYLLKTYEDARSALAELVAARTGVVIGHSLTWLPEREQADGRRPDLEAITADDKVPFVKVEAKLGAELLADQLQSYVQDLLERNSGKGALLVLVPEGRTAEAARVTAEAFPLSESGLWRVTDEHRTGVVGIAVISWDELFAALRGGKVGRFHLELEQLQAMYRELSGDYIAPLAGIEDLLQWRTRATDFVNLVDKATRKLTGKLTTRHNLLPLWVEPLDPRESPKDASQEWQQEGYRLRYVGPSAKNPASFYSIGVRDSFEQTVKTPVWMRFHKDTGGFARIRQRIEASDLQHLESSGHIWIPLEVPLKVSGEKMVEALVAKAEEVVQVAYQAE